MGKQALEPLFIADHQFSTMGLTLSQQFSLAIVDSQPPPDQPYFVLNSDGLSYQINDSVINFNFDIEHLRFRTAHIANEGLRKALNVKKYAGCNVADLTAGAGVDSFLMASWGFKVTAIERHPVVACLLAGAIQHLQTHNEFSNVLNHIHLNHTCGQSYLNSLSSEHFPDMIYLDPMFPHTSKSAQVKKKMQWLQMLCGTDHDNESLLTLSRQKVNLKVIVKRPNDAPFLENEKPNYQVKMKKHRYDVYLPIND